MNTEIIKLTQQPVIVFDAIEAKGLEVKQHIALLDIENIEASEDNLQLIKQTRSQLNAQFKELDSQRITIKNMVMKPYNEFNEAYKKHIETIYKRADTQLKTKAVTVESGILTAKVESLKDYFEKRNMQPFLTYERMSQKVIRSASDYKLQEEIEEFLSTIDGEVDVIKKLDHSHRILAKYELTLNFAQAVQEVTNEVEREEAARAQEEKAKAEKLAREKAAREKEQAELAMQAAEAQARKAQAAKLDIEPEPVIERLEVERELEVEPERILIETGKNPKAVILSVKIPETRLSEFRQLLADFGAVEV